MKVAAIGPQSDWPQYYRQDPHPLVAINCPDFSMIFNDFRSHFPYLILSTQSWFWREQTRMIDILVLIIKGIPGVSSQVKNVHEIYFVHFIAVVT